MSLYGGSDPPESVSIYGIFTRCNVELISMLRRSSGFRSGYFLRPAYWLIRALGQGWDPILILSQMISMQTLHYLTLSLIGPTMLALLAQGPDLDREGGSANVAMLMDWRELSGRSTVPLAVDVEWVSPMFAENASKRSWALALAWLITSMIESVTYQQSESS